MSRNARPGMGRDGSRALERALGWWADAVRSRALAVVLAGIVLTAASLYYTAGHLGIHTDTGDMIAADLPFRRTFREYQRAFPQFSDVLLVVVDGATPGLAEDAARALADRLTPETDLFRSVDLPGGEPFFRTHALLYQSPAELQDLSDRLAEVQPFLARLARDPSLRGFAGTVSLALDAVGEGKAVALTPVLERLADAVAAARGGRFYRLPWQELMSGRPSTPEDRRRFVVVRPQLDWSDLTPGEAAMARVRDAARELSLDPAHGVRVRLTGDVALDTEELESVSRGAERAAVLSFVLVGGILFLGLGRARLVFVTVTTLVMGLVWTAGFATLAVGHLNLISVAFGVLYIGLGVDYSIHLCLRYRELRGAGAEHPEALRGAMASVGSSLALCAVTTAIGFYAFVPTDYAGVAELGLISGTGMFISLAANLTVLPALLTLFPLPPGPARQRGLGLMAALGRLPQRHGRAVRWGALAVGAGSAVLLPRVTFDHNPLHLRDPGAESVATFNDLLAESSTSPWSCELLAPDEAAAAASAARLGRLDDVAKTVYLGDFVPPDQEEKLAIVEQIGLLLGPDLTVQKAPAEPPAARRTAVGDLARGLRRFVTRAPTSRLRASADRLLAALAGLEADLEDAGPAARERTLQALESSLLAGLPGRLRDLEAALDAGPVTRADLPRSLVDQWVSAAGRYRVEVFPREDLGEEGALARFVTELRAVDPEVTGGPVQILESGRAVVGAFRQALGSAVVAISLLLVFLLGRKLDVGFVLVPLLLAGAATGGVMVVIGLPFNFANVIALPLLLGIGVDNGIHMVHRVRTEAPADGNLLGTSTAAGVLYSALTTIGSFGNLAFSPHRGMASMGLLLTLGMALTLAATLVVLPALLQWAPSARLGGRP